MGKNKRKSNKHSKSSTALEKTKKGNKSAKAKTIMPITKIFIIFKIFFLIIGTDKKVKIAIAPIIAALPQSGCKSVRSI